MRSCNPRKPIKLVNRTKHFDKRYSRTHVQFASPNSYQSRSVKQEGYLARLYWQYKYCEDNDGQTYFYTLTYNDEHMPKYLGQNCFDYEDLRDLFTGGFRKKLLRKFGTTFKYFVGAELGDGKGSRGMHNNPHYHVLFFLENAHNPRYPYVKILPEQFRHFVREYWQGFDQDYGFRDFRNAKYGIAREGEPEGIQMATYGRVINFRACCYCAKYVSKDVNLRMHERKVEQHLRREYLKDVRYDDDFYRQFLLDVLFPMYNLPLNAQNTEWSFTEEDIVRSILGKDYVIDYYPDFLGSGMYYQRVVYDIIVKENLWNQFTAYRRQCMEERVRLGLNEYRNRYCNKCRISHGVGDYALDSIDLENPLISVPSKDGFRSRPLPMYYYRKIFTDVVKDTNGSPLRVINQLGIDYKVSRLERQINRMIEKASNNLDLVVGNRDLYEKMFESDVNSEVSYHYDVFLHNLDYLLYENNIEEILKRYAEYKIIYEDRFFKLISMGDSEFGYFPNIDPIMDYRRFLTPTFYTCPRSDLRLSAFLESPPQDWVSYFAHPYFLRYHRVFRVLDLCANYFFVQDDERRQEEAEERARVRRFHDKQKMKDFYAGFGL